MARRMSNGDGTRPRFDKIKNLWRVDITIPDGGGRRTLYGKTEAEVKEKRAKLQEEIKKGCVTDLKTDKLKFGVWLNEWLSTYKKGKVSSNTYSLYDSAIRIWISDKLKDTPVKQLKHQAIQNFINFFGEKHSSQTCGIIRTVMKQSLKMAVKNKYILENPANELEIPRKEGKKATPLTNEETKLLLADRKNTRNYLYYVLSVCTGARIGEVLGLSWDDIDLKNNVIHIRHSLKLNKMTGKHEIGSTKTGKCRDVPILPQVVSAIKHHKAKQTAEKFQIGQSYNAENMVFCNIVGDYLNVPIMQREVNKVVKALSLNPSTTPHTLRHTFVSQMISAGIANIKLISTIVGHTNISITLDTYGHLMPSDTKEAFLALGKHMESINI